VLAKCHDARNLSEYEGDMNIDERLLTDLITACQKVADKVQELEAIKQVVDVHGRWLLVADSDGFPAYLPACAETSAGRPERRRKCRAGG